MSTRKKEKFHVLAAKTERIKNSTVPYLQKILNAKTPRKYEKKKYIKAEFHSPFIPLY